MKKTLLLLFVLSAFMNLCHAQNPFVGAGKKVMDSLNAELQNAKQDTTRLRLLEELVNASPNEDGLKYGEPILELADKVLAHPLNADERKKILKKKVTGFRAIAVYYLQDGTLDSAKVIGYAQKGKKVAEETGDKKAVAQALGTIADVYLAQHNISKATGYDMEGLRMLVEALQDSKGKDTVAAQMKLAVLS